MQKKIIVIGSSGMAGHVLTTYLRENAYFVIDIGPRKKIYGNTVLWDISRFDLLEKILYREKPEVLINCLGVLVKDSENNKANAAYINGFLPHALSDICRAHGISMIHLSTDCVFSGKNGPYRIDDFRDGDSFYDRSKALGELNNQQDLTIRTSIIGPELKSDGTGLFHWLMGQCGNVRGFSNSFWSGLTTLELARFVQTILESKDWISGVLQLSVRDGISKEKLISIINTKFALGLVVEPSDIPFVDKRLIPSVAGDLFDPKSYEEQILDLKLWMDSHPKFYTHYSR